MADDTLTPDKVAAIRVAAIQKQHLDVIALCDTVEALRESANEAARQCFTAEEILDARIKDLDDLREQLRTALTALDTVTNQASRGERKIRRLTAALREIPEPPSFAGKGLIAEIEALIIIETRDGPFAAFVADWLLRCPDALREARALVEMGVSDG